MGSTPAAPTVDVDLRAADVMARVHDALAEAGCDPTLRAATLIRITVCLFAQDTGIFETAAFLRLVEASAEDGSDLGNALACLFAQIGGDPSPTGDRVLHQDGFVRLAGGLFGPSPGPLPTSRDLRDCLLRACALDWSQLSPAVFGSLLQRVMGEDARRGQGVHYTSEDNILAVIDPLFLDELQLALARAARSERKLRELHARIARLQIFDPSCGCGNFLVVAYRRLRQLEHEILEALIAPGQQVLDLDHHLRVTLAQCHGIELQGFAAQVARLSLWLVDHQMSLKAAKRFGHYFARDALSTEPNIREGNALSVPWSDVVSASDETVVMGNPPYGGKKEQSAAQKADMANVWSDVAGGGKLDLVSAWFRLAADFMAGTDARCGFVSTNSITQGEQAGVLWRDLRQRSGVHITFARRSFPWPADGRGAAHVHVVIIGMSHRAASHRRLFDGVAVHDAQRINPYLIDAPDAFVCSRARPLCDAPPMAYGSMMIDRPRGSAPNDGLLVSPDAREAMLAQCPALAPYICPILGGDEFLNGAERYCLWLVDAPEDLVEHSRELARRIAAVREFRCRSGRPQTRHLAETPTLFGEIRQPTTPYLLVPKVSSEARPYLPIGFVEPTVIASGSALTVADATPYHFGVLSSAMHDAWVRAVAGRMKSDLQYSSSIAYNNFPWPASPGDSARSGVGAAALAVLEARQRLTDRPLGQLYRTDAMPAALRDAHRTLDAEVDRCYRSTGFSDHAARVNHLFESHARLTSTAERLAPALER